MRDIENDRIAGKNTLVVKMGLEIAKNYHQLLLIIAVTTFCFFLIITKISTNLILIVYLSLLLHARTVRAAEKYEDFDPELKKVALTTFALSILFWLTLVFLS
jgi:1,4-dihydroxy-2-naphthoate octaprenyltransferase